MKTKNILKSTAVIVLIMLLSTTLFAQEKPAKPEKPVKMEKPEKPAKTEKHSKDDACCSTETKVAKHTCTDECGKIGCAAVKEKEAKAAKISKENKPEKPAKVTVVKYECPMKCEPASDKPGKCSKCKMELKKV